MLHAAATFAGLFILALLLVGPLAEGRELVVAAVLAGVATLLGVWFGGASATFSQALAALGGSWRAAARVVRGALKTIRAAVAADVSMRPALVRVSSGRGDQRGRARIAHAVGAAPAAVVVDADEQGVLVHVNDEHDGDVAELENIAAGLSGPSGGGR